MPAVLKPVQGGFLFLQYPLNLDHDIHNPRSRYCRELYPHLLVIMSGSGLLSSFSLSRRRNNRPEETTTTSESPQKSPSTNTEPTAASTLSNEQSAPKQSLHENDKNDVEASSSTEGERSEQDRVQTIYYFARLELSNNHFN